MNELPGSRIHALYAKGSGVARGQTLQVAVRKCMAETYSRSKKKRDFGERSMPFSTEFYYKSIWAMLIRDKCKFLFE